MGKKRRSEELLKENARIHKNTMIYQMEKDGKRKDKLRYRGLFN